MMPETASETCPACAARRVHSVREWRDYHPLAGHGYAEGQGWTCPRVWHDAKENESNDQNQTGHADHQGN